MANRYANLVGSNKIKDEYQKINQGFDKVEQEMDAKPDKSIAQVNDVQMGTDDTLIIEGSTGITVTTNPTQKKVIVTATGTSTPGPHGPSHNHDGADPIPDLVQLRDDLNAHLNEKAQDDVHSLLSDGKIIEESGSNANGQYVRFADGTQICWRKIEVDTSRTDTQSFSFPASFSVNREHIAVGYGLHFPTQNQIDAWYEGKGVVSSTESSWSTRFRSNQSSIVDVVEIRVIAIGRWK